MTLTALTYALLGLVRATPRTGYALRKVFEDTPMGSFSSSPGSIYPALDKLVRAELLERRPPATGGKPLFHITAEGEATMLRWLKTPVSQEEISKTANIALLRFAFLQDVDDLQITRDFLESFESAVRAQIASLDTYLTSPDAAGLSPHGRIAVDHGVRTYGAHLDWVLHAKKEFASC